MKQLLHLLAFGLLVPSTALAQVDAEVAAQCRDARDFYGCVRAFTTPVRRSDDIDCPAVLVFDHWVAINTSNLTIGSAHQSASGEVNQIEVCGLNCQTGLPQSVTVTSAEICEAIQEPLRFINDAIKKVLDNVPAELAADVYTNGIVLAGGGALIPGISELITESTGQ